MKLHKLLQGIMADEIKGNKYLDINNIYYDSKQLRPGGLFFAISGSRFRGLDFVDEAIERGAVCIVAEEDFITYKNVCKVMVKDIRKACAIVANNFYNYPSHKMNVVGITGTNGKTTTLHLVESILKQAGKNCGTIGTISYNVAGRSIPATNTTPSAIMLQMLLNDMLKTSTLYCVMEVSSHSLHQSRVDGIKYRNTIYTNLSSEHLDYHKDEEDYFNAKNRLFLMQQEDDQAILNIDDAYASRIIKTTKANVITYGIKNPADITAFDIDISIKGTTFKVDTPKGKLDITSPLIGEYNIYNILAAVAFAVYDGISLNYIAGGIRNFKGAPGRLQKIDCGQDFSVFVDYAHTDSAMANVLTALRYLAMGNIIVVFGCGGDRDKKKRPRMGKVTAELADHLVITSDNPRSEDPKKIIDDIVSGLPRDFENYEVALDRKKAIDTALRLARPNDIVLIAGKGHESYQVLRDTVVAFDDRKIVEEILSDAIV